jgi:hypothetical protein
LTRHHDDVLVAHGQGRRARHALGWGCLLLLATGVAWLLGHDVWLQQTPFGAQPHPLVAWLLRAHGAIAWCTAVLVGVVWQVHVRPAWRSLRRRRDHRRRNPALRPLGHGRARTVSGALLVIALALLLGTAIGLQYAPEEAHRWLSVTHWVVGLALTAVLCWHWLARLRGPGLGDPR